MGALIGLTFFPCRFPPTLLLFSSARAHREVTLVSKWHQQPASPSSEAFQGQVALGERTLETSSIFLISLLFTNVEMEDLGRGNHSYNRQHNYRPHIWFPEKTTTQTTCPMILPWLPGVQLNSSEKLSASVSVSAQTTCCQRPREAGHKPITADAPEVLRW